MPPLLSVPALYRAFFLLGVLAVTSAAAAPSPEDCGLEPPGSLIGPPIQRKPGEAPASRSEPPRVRRVEVDVDERGVTAQGFGVPMTRTKTGSLSGKTVYVSAGHGFTWNDTLGRWVTQRGTTHSIIEDLVSIETVNQFLVPLLTGAGATVVPVRELDLNTRMVITDNGGTGYTESGDATVFHDSSLAGWGAPALPMASGTNPFELGTNRLMETATTVTAQASWVPTIPAAGYYNVYVSHTAFTARVSDAHFVVKHAGGEAHFRVNQKRHGGTWVFLGRFYFRPGASATAGAVVALNDSREVGNVSLDAVRLGGGGAQITRGGTVSGRPRFEEAARYHAQFSGAPTTVYDASSTDQNDDVGTRSRFAAWDHEDGEDAVYLAWHTNAFNGTGTGTESYVYGPNPPDGTYNFTGVAGSDRLVQAVHGELVKDIRSGWQSTWTDRGIRSAYFGELNPAHNPETPAALVEVGFHDAAGDAGKLKEPGFRYLAARALMQGIIRYYATRDGRTAVLPPEPPTHLSARNLGAGKVEVRWRAPVVDTVDLGGQAATTWRVYFSADGTAWNEGTAVTTTTYSTTLPNGSVGYFRVASVNAGGESFPSETVGVGVVPTAPAPVLIVNGYDRFDSTLGFVEDLSAHGLGPTLRLLVERMNDGGYVRHHGRPLALNATGFDSATNEAVTAGAVVLSSYGATDWFVGRGGAGGAALSSAEQTAVKNYLAGGGTLLLSGSHLASRLAAGTTTDRAFLEGTLLARQGTGTGRLSVDGQSTGPLAGLTGLALDDGFKGTYPAGSTDVLVPNGSASAALYTGTTATAAVSSTAGRVLFLAFPFETVVSVDQRAQLMQRFLSFAGVSPALGPVAVTAPELGGTSDEATLSASVARGDDASEEPVGCGATGGSLATLGMLLVPLLWPHRRRRGG